METIAQGIADSSAQNSRDISTKVALNNARKSLGDIDNDFITEAQIPDFIGTIEKLARSHAVTLDIGSISLGGGPGDVAPRPLALRLSGSAAWKGCVDFIASLDAAHYAIDIGDVSLSGDKKGWNFSIEMVQYVTK
jgi:hypothetical protein